MFQNIYYDKEKRKIHIWDDTKGYFSMPYKRYAYVKDRGGTHTSIYGDRLKKVWNFDIFNTRGILQYFFLDSVHLGNHIT